MLEERGIAAVMAVVAEAIGGTAAVLSPRGETIAEQSHGQRLDEAARAALREAIAGRAVAPDAPPSGGSGSKRPPDGRFEPHPSGAASPLSIEIPGTRRCSCR